MDATRWRKDADTPKPKSFTAWLKTHADQDNAMGDLARDVSRDPEWPSRKGLPGQHTYLEERGAISAAIETLERAWTQYEQYKAAQDK
ncbi:YozE family protein [Streptomyces mirabilis]|uniref:YozE family protein n=1 Tax=Streptomyces mirabilis TaxID=68239 RepID=UPI00364F793A